jgi:hypothetical protein
MALLSCLPTPSRKYIQRRLCACGKTLFIIAYFISSSDPGFPGGSVVGFAPGEFDSSSSDEKAMESTTKQV